MSRLPQKSALVTGGASGIGKAIAQRLKVDGAHVTISDVQRDVGQATAEELGFVFIEHDVCNEARWTDVIGEVEDRRGRLDILVNNAGIAGPMGATNPDNTPLSVWKMIFAINVEGVFLGCRAAIPAMTRAGSGSIVNISSIAGLLATPYNMAYGASKAAVTQMTKSVAQHCAQHRLNIRCNSVHPGDVHTALWDKVADETARQQGVSAQQVIEAQGINYPMGGLTLAEDVAAVVSFLASDEARRITAAKLVVDGGLVGCDTYHMVARNSLYSERPKVAV